MMTAEIGYSSVFPPAAEFAGRLVAPGLKTPG